jgi:hypothetical protein
VIANRRHGTVEWLETLNVPSGASNLDADTKGLLEAYCEGINASFNAQQKAGTLHPTVQEARSDTRKVDSAGLPVELVARGAILRGRWHAGFDGVAQPFAPATGTTATAPTKRILGG